MPTGATVFYGCRAKQYHRRLKKNLRTGKLAVSVIMVLGMGATSRANHYYVSVRVAWPPPDLDAPKGQHPPCVLVGSVAAQAATHGGRRFSDFSKLITSDSLRDKDESC
jgi:hypothetical protein